MVRLFKRQWKGKKTGSPETLDPFFYGLFSNLIDLLVVLVLEEDMVVLTCIHVASATAEMPSPDPSSGDQAQFPGCWILFMAFDILYGRLVVLADDTTRVTGVIVRSGSSRITF